MKQNYLISFICLFLFIGITSCSKDKDDDYVVIDPDPETPVSVDLTKVPYRYLSEYYFFKGNLKNQEPVDGVLPYEPSSSLFTDYAYKKRFVWLPKNTKATYNGDGNVLELPVGAALIKTFYYDDVQNVSPIGSSRIVETRIMIRKSDGWIFANYVWNEDQTEAEFDVAGSFTDVAFKDQNGVIKNVNYRIPSEAQCIVCHKAKTIVNGEETSIHIPIGIKPQYLNFNYNYTTGSKNQLTKWIEDNYLESNFALPNPDNTVVNYNDASKPLEQRVRAYFDINCAHCHQTDRHCDYRPMRFAYSETNGNLANMGVCVDTQDMQGLPSELGQIITPQRIDRSMLYYRLNTNDETYRMPLHGRTILHEEGLALIRDWINSLERCE